MKNENRIVLEEMRKLIKQSCRFTDRNSREAGKFQTSLLKFFFGVAEVTINYENKTITLWKSGRNDTETLYRLSEAIGTKISYTNLEETLKGCLENGERPHRFYRTMLFHYNKVQEKVVQEFMSA